ncbi:MAG: hypothetical protein M3290_08790 [Actinomycetota bacterium]|nr:hypothetical protein [Actinomycetota bacterium]
MRHRSRRNPFVTYVALVVTVVGASLVGAAVSHASSQACSISFTDPAGDANNTAEGGSGTVDNLDVIAGGPLSDDGKQLTTQMQIKKLDMSIPANGQSVNWYFLWTYDSTTYFSRARVDITAPSTPVYSFGTYDATTSRFSSIGSTTGAFNAGANGTVLVNVPLDQVGSPPAGSALTGLNAQTYVGQGVGVTSLSQADQAPDSGSGSDYTMGSCAGGSSPSTSPSGSNNPSPASPDARLRFSDRTPKFGSNIKANASLGTCNGLSGTKIQLQRKIGAKFKKVATKVLDSHCKATFKVKATFKSATFRSYWPKQNDAYRAAASKPQTVKTHA